MGKLLVVAVLIGMWRPACHPAASGGGAGTEGGPCAFSKVPLARIVDSLGVDPSTVSFHVIKSQRLFQVKSGERLLKSYPCVLGTQPVGDKQCQGDRRTPEGTFTFRSKRIHPKWHRFIWVDYPNAESWRRFRERSSQGAIPPGKAIGGEIGLHGVPMGMDRLVDTGVDWTLGCIALKNADVEEVYALVIPQHTVIHIGP